MPACNIQVLGQQKKTLTGFSQVTALPHTGFVYYCDIVQDAPPVSCETFFIIKLVFDVHL